MIVVSLRCIRNPIHQTPNCDLANNPSTVKIDTEIACISSINTTTQGKAYKYKGKKRGACW